MRYYRYRRYDYHDYLAYLVYYWPLIVILLIILFLVLRRTRPEIFSHWYHLIENLRHSSQDFYASLENAIASRQLPDVEVCRVDFHEGGIFSANRLYLRVTRKDHIFDICAAPFGNGFFVSWWLGATLSLFWRLMLKIPLLGMALLRIFRPTTYYRLDTALMFQESIRKTVLDVIDATTTSNGLRSLTEAERKPILSDLFQRYRKWR